VSIVNALQLEAARATPVSP